MSASTTTTTKTSPSAPAAAPMPAPIPFFRLLRVEWRKATDTRAARWLLLATVLAGAAFTVIPVAIPDEISQTYPGYLFLTISGLGILLPVVAILAITSEWTQRNVMVTFTQEPRRGRVMLAKLLAVILLGVAILPIAHLLTLGGLGISDMVGREIDYSIGWQDVAGTGIYSLAVVTMGAAFGMLILHSAGAIVAYFLVPMVISLLSAFEVFSFVNEWLNTERTLALVVDWDWSGNGGPIAVSLLVWVAAPAVLGLLRVLRKEIQ